MLLGVVLPGEGELLPCLLAGEPGAPAQAMARALEEAVPIWILPEDRGIGQINKIVSLRQVPKCRENDNGQDSRGKGTAAPANSNYLMYRWSGPRRGRPGPCRHYDEKGQK